MYTDTSRERPLLTEIWYPTTDKLIDTLKKKRDIFKTLTTVNDAGIENKKFPLLLVSHGTGGNRFSLTWMIEELVQEGYIVVSLDHYGNSTTNKIPREFVKWWERAIDVQYVLDELLKDPVFSDKIDRDRIGGLGFSLGGYTNLALAGAYVDRTIQEGEERGTPPEFPKTDEVIDFETDSLILASYDKYRHKVKDERFKSFFVMAPAIGFGFHSKEQTKTITAPVFIVAGQADEICPIEENALKFKDLIPTSEAHIFDGKVGHYVFLNEATDFGKEVAPFICVDPPGVDRADIHRQTTEMAVRFFESSLNK